MKKFFRIIQQLFYVLLFFIAALIAISYYYRNDITAIIIGQLNKQLDTKISPAKIRFEPIRRFPNASIEFQNIVAFSTAGFNKKDIPINADTLFKFHRLYVELNLIDIAKKEYKIKKVSAQKGFVNLFYDKNGNNNFQLWKKQNNGNSNNTLELKAIELSNTRLQYINGYKRNYLNCSFDKLSLNGNFSAKRFNLKVQTYGNLNKVQVGKTTYIHKKRPFSLETDFKVENKTYAIKKGTISVAGISTNLSGYFKSGKTTEINIYAKGNGLNLLQLRKMLPATSRKKLNTYNIGGKFRFESKITGSVSKYTNPHIVAAFGIDNGILVHTPSKLRLENVTLQGVFTNGKKNANASTFLQIKKFTFNTAQSQFTGNAQIQNFESPSIKFNSNATIQLGELFPFLGINTITNVSGTLEGESQFTMHFPDWSTIQTRYIDWNNSNTHVKVKQVKLDYQDSVHIKSLNGELQVNGPTAKIDNLSFQLFNNPITLKASINNFVELLHAEHTKPLKVKSVISTKYLDILRLQSLFSGSNKSDETSEKIPFFVDTDIIANKLTWKKLSATNVKATAQISNSNLNIESLTADAFDGQIEGNGAINYSNKKSVTTDFKTQNVNIRKLFKAFNNFGQEELSYENINGSLTGKIQMSSKFDNDWKVRLASLNAFANISIKNGELVNFEPMEKLSRFVEIDALKAVKFSELKNAFTIRNQVITIPEMKIESSAFNLTASGIHRFNNTYEYHTQVEVADLIWKRSGKTREQFFDKYPIEDDGVRTMLPLKIVNDGEKIKINWDRKTVAKKIKQEFKEEKQELKQILKKEFSRKKDTTPTTKKQPKFIIEWDDE